MTTPKEQPRDPFMIAYMEKLTEHLDELMHAWLAIAPFAPPQLSLGAELDSIALRSPWLSMPRRCLSLLMLSTEVDVTEHIVPRIKAEAVIRQRLVEHIMARGAECQKTYQIACKIGDVDSARRWAQTMLAVDQITEYIAQGISRPEVAVELWDCGVEPHQITPRLIDALSGGEDVEAAVGRITHQEWIASGSEHYILYGED